MRTFRQPRRVAPVPALTGEIELDRSYDQVPPALAAEEGLTGDIKDSAPAFRPVNEKTYIIQNDLW
jgi:hypothetical protein